MGRLTALDAARPLFDDCGPEARVDKSDADYVDFIHTDSGHFPALSMAAAVGDADFYVNDGRHQPGCSEIDPDTGCDHHRAVQIWINSFRVRCTACPCKSYDDLLAGLCNECKEPNVVGYYSNPVTKKSIYYFATTDNAPYCK